MLEVINNLCEAVKVLTLLQSSHILKLSEKTTNNAYTVSFLHPLISRWRGDTDNLANELLTIIIFNYERI